MRALGMVFMAMAFLGAFLPVLPTTPFVLVAASLFARSSPRLHRRLLSSRLFGATVRRWEETGSISRRAKVLAVAMLWLTIGLSVGLAVESGVLRGFLVVVAGGVTGFILSRPTGSPSPRPEDD